MLVLTHPHLQYIGRGFGGSARKSAGDFTGDIQIDEEITDRAYELGSLLGNTIQKHYGWNPYRSSE